MTQGSAEFDNPREIPARTTVAARFIGTEFLAAMQMIGQAFELAHVAPYQTLQDGHPGRPIGQPHDPRNDLGQL